MTPTQRAAMDCLDRLAPFVHGLGKAVLAELRAALAEQPAEQEPWKYQIWNEADVKWELTDDSGWPAEPLYTSPQPAIPPGYKLVPVEPTPEMLEAMKRLWIGAWEWKKLLAAAPEAPQLERRVPLTDERIGAVLAAAFPNDAEPDGSWKLAQYERDIFRVAEQAHGITGETE